MLKVDKLRGIRLSSLWLIAILSLLLLAGCGMCGNDVLEDVKSPNGKRHAVIFGRHCGATTGFSTQVSILRSSETVPKGTGNTFIADDDHGAVRVGVKGTMDVRLRWESDEVLIITYPQEARVFQKEGNRAGVNIRYETTSASSSPPGS